MRLADLFFLSRPTLFFVNWIILILGFHCPGNAPADSLNLWLLMLEYACISGAAVIVNQLHDLESDRANGKLLILDQGLVSVRAAWTLALGLLLSGIGVSLWLGWLNSLLTVGFFVLSGLVYNLPPLATKNRPWAGMVTLAPATSALYLQAALLGGLEDPGSGVLHSLPILLACLGVGLLTTLPDREGDRQNGKRTFPVCYGEARTWQLAALFLLASCATGLALGQWVVALPALGALGLTAWGARQPDSSEAGPVSRWSILLQALALVPGWPWFGALMLGFWCAARVYYRRRFGLVYPRLGRDHGESA